MNPSRQLIQATEGRMQASIDKHIQDNDEYFIFNTDPNNKQGNLWENPNVPQDVQKERKIQQRIIKQNTDGMYSNLNTSISTDKVSAGGTINFDTNVARNELDRQYASEEDIKAAKAFKAQDDINYDRAVENGYTGPKNNIVIPNKHKADMKAATKVDLQATLNSLGLTGNTTIDANGAVNNYGLSKQFSSAIIGGNKNFDPNTGEHVDNTLYAAYGSKNWKANAGMVEDNSGKALSSYGKVNYVNGNHNFNIGHTDNGNSYKTEANYTYTIPTNSNTQQEKRIRYLSRLRNSN